MQEQTKGVKTFIRLLMNEFDMDENEMNGIWDKYLKSIPQQEENKFTHSELRKLKKKELEELCKKDGISHSGTKQALISRLLGDNVTTSTPTSLIQKSKAPTSRDVFQMIKNSSTIHIRRNVFGNYEHSDTGLVFDEISKKVIGKQHSDGTIIPLASQDIDVCKQYLFNYEIPYTIRDIYEN